MSTQLKDIIRELERRGHRVETASRGGHKKVYHASGKGLVVLPHTPSGGRGEKNMMSLLKRQGFLD